jgi:nitrile hydratase
MNSIHDLGGMDGFTLPERDQGPVLKEEWERQLWGSVMAVWARSIGGYRGGSRADLERIPPALYLTMPYYAKWLYGQEVSLVESGLATNEELDNPDGPMNIPQIPGFVPATPADVAAFITGDSSYELAATVPPRYGVGDEVIVRNEHPAGYTRVPRYVRGHRGVIQKHHGVHVFEDDVAKGEDPGQQHLYTVTFTGPELWGSRGRENDRISADLWEIHLETAA